LEKFLPRRWIVGGKIEYSGKLREEIRRLEETNVHWSADLLVSAIEPTEGSSRADESETESTTEVAADGGWIGSRGLLLPGDVTGGDMVRELRNQTAAAARTEESASDLLGLWITVEPLLSDAEMDELRRATFARIFGDHENEVTLSRNSDGPEGGGY
jgi:hypothetical protein